MFSKVMLFWCERLMKILCGFYLKAHHDPVALEDPDFLVLQWFPCCCPNLSSGQKRSLGDLECPQCPFCQARALLENTLPRPAILHTDYPAELIVRPVSENGKKSHVVGLHPMLREWITLVPKDQTK